MCRTWKDQKAKIKDTVKRIPVLGKILFWVYCFLKMPITLRHMANMNNVANMKSTCCYLGNDIAITKVRDFKMLVSTKDIGVFPYLILDSFWEMHITPLFESIAKEGFTVVDIGANVGYYTLVAAQRVGKKGKVYAFEPEPRSFDILCKNIKINGFVDTVTACQKALLDREEKLSFTIYEENASSSSIFVNNSIFVSKPDKKRLISVQTTTVDAFLGDNLRGDLIKMDAEGAEPFIFEGMKNVIENSPTLKIIMEFAPTHVVAVGKNPKDFLRSLKNMGFVINLIARNSGQLSRVNINSLVNCEIEDLFLEKSS